MHLVPIAFSFARKREHRPYSLRLIIGYICFCTDGSSSVQSRT